MEQSTGSSQLTGRQRNSQLTERQQKWTHRYRLASRKPQGNPSKNGSKSQGPARKRPIAHD